MGRDDGERARPWADGAPRRARWKAPFVAPAYGLVSCGAPRYLRHALRHAQSAPRHAFPYRARSVANLDICATLCATLERGASHDGLLSTMSPSRSLRSMGSRYVWLPNTPFLSQVATTWRACAGVKD